MGEAKRRGTFAEREAEAIAKREAHEKREAEWNVKQAERRRIHLEELAKEDASRQIVRTKRARPNLVLATALALAASMNTLPSK